MLFKVILFTKCADDNTLSYAKNFQNYYIIPVTEVVKYILWFAARPGKLS